MHVLRKSHKIQIFPSSIISWFVFLMKMDFLTHGAVTVYHQNINVGYLIAQLSVSHSVECESIIYIILLLTMFAGNTEWQLY